MFSDKLYFQAMYEVLTSEQTYKKSLETLEKQVIISFTFNTINTFDP